MKFIKVASHTDIVKIDKERKIILFFKKGTSNSDCAYQNIEKITDGEIFIVDVNTVKDIHSQYGVNSVPSLVVVKNDSVQNVVKGCQTESYYDQIINEKTVSISYSSTEKQQKRVTVYSTPTCTYCNKIKQYFNKHGIKYTDINVAANQQAAIEMAQRSGQRGVPQTDINGQIIVGFDVQKLSKLLNIPTE
jgi:glutaredoxin-like YruB-family protein